MKMFNGKRLIYCNYFVPEHVDAYTPKSIQEESDPSRHFIAVEDGGAGSWQVYYDLDSKTCTALSINCSP